MSASSTYEKTSSHIIPIVPENLYISLFQLIKKLLCFGKRLTVSEIKALLLKDQKTQIFGKFNEREKKITRHKILQTLNILCKEKKVTRHRTRYTLAFSNIPNISQIVQKRISINNLVS